MDMWMSLILAFHVLVALAIIGLVLLQHGKGADMGSGFGSGSSGSLFGATGSANFLSRMTAALATVFFLTSLGLAYLATHKPKATGGLLDSVKTDAGVTPKAADKPAAGKPAAPVQPAGAKDAGGDSKAKDVPQ
ncbi:MAG: preprotein translocase subunit SecG [Betaproteobacteria bacterium]|nr:preprotein translocase subunit SecG [Betaproteobacteria bacterium]